MRSLQILLLLSAMAGCTGGITPSNLDKASGPTDETDDDTEDTRETDGDADTDADSDADADADADTDTDTDTDDSAG